MPGDIDIDFGEIYYISSPSSHFSSHTYTAINRHPFPVVLKLTKDLVQTNFPVQVKLSDAKDPTGDESSLIIPEFETRELNLLLLPIENEIIAQQHYATSFFKVSSSVKAEYWKETSGRNDEVSELVEEVTITYTATLCTSILYVEETEIVFEACQPGNLKHAEKDLQIWNRSECTLICKIDKIVDTSKNPRLQHDCITFEDRDSGKAVNTGDEIIVAPFSSKRVRSTFRADVSFEQAESATIAYRIFNMHNSKNVQQLSYNIRSTSEHGNVMDVDMDPCYYGSQRMSRFYVNNNTDDGRYM